MSMSWAITGPTAWTVAIWWRTARFRSPTSLDGSPTLRSRVTSHAWGVGSERRAIFKWHVLSTDANANDFFLRVGAGLVAMDPEARPFALAYPVQIRRYIC